MNIRRRRLVSICRRLEDAADHGRVGRWLRGSMVGVGLFDGVVEAYDQGRPEYPPGVYEALAPLDRRLVLEGGAGTGIATRQLRGRGASVVPFDLGPAILRRALERTPGLPGVIADGASLPFRDRCADLVCFAQSWHWLDPAQRCGEAARVLRATGRWAGWWSHARADGQVWFDRYWSVIESATVGRREHRDTDWGVELDRSGLFDVSPRITVPWTRELLVETFLAEVSSYSYVSTLAQADRQELLAVVDDDVRGAFPSGLMEVDYQTWLWIARPAAN